MKPTKLPTDWSPTEFDVSYAKERGFTDDEIDDIAEDFATYWTLGMGRNKTHMCWSGAGRSCWGTWIRRTTLKRKPADEPYVNGVDPDELKHSKDVCHLSEIVAKRRLELCHKYSILTEDERCRADKYLAGTSGG